MIDPKSLKPGQHVRIWITGMIGDKTARVTEQVSRYGWPVLKVDDDPTWPLLKHEDYLVREILPD